MYLYHRHEFMRTQTTGTEGIRQTMIYNGTPPILILRIQFDCLNLTPKLANRISLQKANDRHTNLAHSSGQLGGKALITWCFTLWVSP